MSSTNNKWHSKDGKYYDDYWEKKAADEAWEIQRKEQQQQNALLAEQNRLLQEQTNRKEKLEREKLEFERQKEESRYYEMLEQQEHDKEMRILGLFDSIGLNKRYYDNFIKYLINKQTTKLLEEVNSIKAKEEHIEDVIIIIDNILKNPISEIDSYLYEIKHLNFGSPEDESINNTITKCYEKDSKIKKYKSKCKKALDSLSLSEITIDEIEKFAESKNMMKNYKNLNINSNKWIIIWSLILVISTWIFITLCRTDGGDEHFLFILSMVFSMISIVAVPIVIAAKNSRKKFLKDLLSKQLEINDESLSETKISIEFAKLKEEKQNELNKLDVKVTDIKQNISKELAIKWNNFIEFRKSHYISQFENLLLDLELKQQIEDLGLEYPKINNNNKSGDGTIDDYIAYFDSLSD